jgi:ZIP family zinc transporter
MLLPIGRVLEQAHSCKRSGDQQVNAGQGGGVAIAIGSHLDEIPESAVAGSGLLSWKGSRLKPNS